MSNLNSSVALVAPLAPKGAFMSKLGLQSDGSYNIPALKLDTLRAVVAKLNRRAGKLDQDGLSLVLVSSFNVNVYNDQAQVTRVYPVSNVRIGGHVPQINGWKIIARIEHLGEAGNLISKAPNAYDRELPEHFRTCKATCDHCNTIRLRNDTFVLENESGDMKRVGRNCLADFLRTDDIARAVGIYSLISKVQSAIVGECDEGAYFGGGSNTGHIGTLYYLALVVAAIRLHGWLSKKESYEQGGIPTAERAESNSIGKPIESDVVEAAQVFEWCQSLGERDNLSDYLNNLRVGSSLGYVDNRSKGIVASAVQAFRRELADEQARALRTNAAPSCHVGKVGDKLSFTATVTRVFLKDGMYGLTTIVGMEDKAGNNYTWFASGRKDVKVGQAVQVKGTVKSHGEFQGVKQTTLTRCKLA